MRANIKSLTVFGSAFNEGQPNRLRTCSSQIKFLGVLHKTFPSPSSDVHSGAKFERQFWISWPPGGALLDKFPKSGRGASALWPPGWDKAVTLPANAHPSTKEEDRLSIFTRRPPKWGAAAAAESWHQTRSFRSMLLPIPPPPPSDDMSFQHLWMDKKVQSKKSIINKQQHKVSILWWITNSVGKARWFESYLNPHATSGDNTSAKLLMKHPFTGFATSKT